MSQQLTLTPKEVESIYGITERQLRRHRSQGSGPPYTRPSPRVILYWRDEVEAWLNEHRVDG
mgnify:CR=1 FL=1